MKNSILTAILLSSIIACNDSSTDNENKSNNTATEASAPTNGVYVVNHKDGDKVSSPVIIEMGVHGMEVEPAGEIKEGKGHHHIIIDDSFIEKDIMVPADDNHLHYGKGQLVDTLTLLPGKHTITLQFANGMHMSYGKEWSSTITLNVE